jgi:hypothetical protein
MESIKLTFVGLGLARSTIEGVNRASSIAVAVLGCVLAAAPWAAQARAGGGGHGGGAHAGSGHAAGARVGGGSHASAGRPSGGGHFASAAHYSGGARGYGGYASAYAGHLGGYRGVGGGFHGYSTGAYWGGGHWRGGWWPRAHYGAGFAWFLPVLPLAYARYWYAGIPYYYANDMYYTWSPDYSGYVATDPPPVADPSGAAAGPDAPPANAYPGGYAAAPQPPQDTATASPAPMSSQGDRMFIYPSQGQSAEQQRTDKLECEKWASDEVGLGSNGPDYQRAMAACLKGRGYSVN